MASLSSINHDILKLLYSTSYIIQNIAHRNLNFIKENINTFTSESFFWRKYKLTVSSWMQQIWHILYDNFNEKYFSKFRPLHPLPSRKFIFTNTSVLYVVYLNQIKSLVIDIRRFYVNNLDI